MIDLSKYQGIIFDMDGTLIDSMTGHMVAWEQTCHHFGYPFEPSYMNSLGGVPTQQTVVLLNEKFSLSHDPSAVAGKKREFWEQMNISPQVVPQMVALLNHYHSKVPIAVGTGAERSHAEDLLNTHNILPSLSALVTATDVTHGKPHPETFQSAAQLMGLMPKHCVVFEDTMIGVQAANDGEMDCYLVSLGEIIDFFPATEK